jgi:transcriptional regulator with PAS, ATPase and Fis domain
VRAGSFRADLYYRLNGAHLQLPPLRERGDFAWLVRRMLAESGAPAPSIAPEVMDWLRAWRWPGNLRELRNVLEYATAVCSGGYIQLADLPDALLAAAARAAQEDVPAPIVLPPEAQLLQQYLRAAHWNVTAVAKQLGVARMTLHRSIGGRSGGGSRHRIIAAGEGGSPIQLRRSRRARRASRREADNPVTGRSPVVPIIRAASASSARCAKR